VPGRRTVSTVLPTALVSGWPMVRGY